ncbi:DUF5666 domain-containing protein [Nocardia lijiangensis]|uniref:DUF5666 domain-containing protein n=1 Tax=Nocardia lijiangensis TaxID=299618 RepID=UPI00083752D3|nr:DUF5666 domain-containing protein [Nocardia lijiangensis]
MTNPKDPWGQRPGDTPTEHLGPPGASGYDPSGDTTRYPTPEQFEWGPPPENATKQLPPMESQWGGYEGGYGNQYPGGPQFPGAQGMNQPGGVPPGAVPPGGPPMDQQPPKRNTGLWVALTLGVVALVAVAGVVAGLVLGERDSSSTTAAATATHTTTHHPPGQPGPSKLPEMPGLPGIDGIGATMGTISANEAGQLIIDTLSGNTMNVLTDELTQVISLSGAKPADLPVGDMVMVQGDKGQDGSIRAKIIISTALPGGTR